MMTIFRRQLTGWMFGLLTLVGALLITPAQGRADLIPGLCSLTEGSGADCFTNGVYDNSTGTWYAEGSTGVNEAESAAPTATYVPGVQSCSSATLVGTCMNPADYLYNYTFSISSNGYITNAEPSFITFYDIGGYVVGSAAADSQLVLAGLATMTDTLQCGTNPLCTPVAQMGEVNPPSSFGQITDSPYEWNITLTDALSVPLVGDQYNDGIAFESTLGPSYLTIQYDAAWQAEQTPVGPPYVPDAGIAEVPLPMDTTPEPGTLVLMGGALLGMGAIRRRRAAAK